MKTIILNLLITGTIVFTLVSLEGCTSSNGWRFSIGVSPVTEINDNQALKPEKLTQAKYNKTLPQGGY
jgi:hypothetical protein